MLSYFKDFVNVVIGNGTFNYFNTNVIVDLICIVLIILTLFGFCKLLFGVFKFFANIIK